MKKDSYIDICSDNVLHFYVQRMSIILNRVSPFRKEPVSTFKLSCHGSDFLVEAKNLFEDFILLNLFD